MARSASNRKYMTESQTQFIKEYAQSLRALGYNAVVKYRHDEGITDIHAERGADILNISYQRPPASRSKKK